MSDPRMEEIGNKTCCHIPQSSWMIKTESPRLQQLFGRLTTACEDVSQIVWRSYDEKDTFPSTARGIGWS